MERHHGYVYETRTARQERNSRRRKLFRVTTEDLKARPIAPTVRMKDVVFLVTYSGQLP